MSPHRRLYKGDKHILADGIAEQPLERVDESAHVEDWPRETGLTVFESQEHAASTPQLPGGVTGDGNLEDVRCKARRNPTQPENAVLVNEQRQTIVGDLKQLPDSVLQ